LQSRSFIKTGIDKGAHCLMFKHYLFFRVRLLSLQFQSLLGGHCLRFIDTLIIDVLNVSHRVSFSVKPPS